MAKGWHHPGKLYSNMIDMKLAFEWNVMSWPSRWGCKCDYSQVKCHYPRETDNKHTMNEIICVSLVRTPLYVWEHSHESADNPLECHVPRKYDPRRNQPLRFSTVSRAWREGGRMRRQRRLGKGGSGFGQVGSMKPLIMMLRNS